MIHGLRIKNGGFDIFCVSKYAPNLQANFYQWCIDYYGKAIGSISVLEINEELKFCEIGYCIGKKWWHNGITPEALRHVKNFLINKVGFEHLWAWHHIDNLNSGLVLSKCGFSYVG